MAGLMPLAAALLVAASQSPPGNVDWPSYGGSTDEHHYSGLEEINVETVKRLGLAWSADLPTTISTVGAPIAVEGKLYVPYGLSLVNAYDAVSGRLLWTFDAEVAKIGGYAMRQAWGIRGITWGDGRLFIGTQDGRLIALDPKSGKPIWSVQTTQPGDGLYITGAPRFFGGKVIIGNGGADFANVRGYVTAYDAGTGAQRWRFFTVPGDPAKGFENEAMAMAAKTWTGEWWKLGGGGTPWNAITYDAELNRIYVGTGNGGPWNQKIRSPGGGDNLFLASIVALDADTGKYLWHYQENPGETWDYNSAMDIQVATLRIGDADRRVLLHAPKNGFFYVIDRETGRLISAEPITKVTWASHIDVTTGRPVENPQARFRDGPALVYPGTQGAHGPEPMAFSQSTGLVYIPTNLVPAYFKDDEVDLKNWKRLPGIYTGVKPFELENLEEPDRTPYGALQAWDPVTQRRAWSVPLLFPVNGGVLATAGNLVFQGQADGVFAARDARSGDLLWSFDAQNGLRSQPISYRVGGRQYVTIVTGFAGAGAAFGPAAARLGWNYGDQQRRVLTFALDAKKKLPARTPAQPMAIADDPAFVVDEAKAKSGHLLYYHNCMVCHGIEAVAGGSAPDLRMSAVPLSAESFSAVVKDGVLIERAMPRFDEMTSDDLDALRHYIRRQARRSPQSAAVQ